MSNFIINNVSDRVNNSTDYLSVIAIVISVMSVVVSYYITYLGKKLEVRHKEFESLCISNVENTLSNLDELFKNHENDSIDLYLTVITNTMIELQLVLMAMKESVYTKIDLKYFISLTEEFTDYVYNNNKASILEFKGVYYKMKLNTFNSLYKYAMEEEFRVFKIPLISNISNSKLKRKY